MTSVNGNTFSSWKGCGFTSKWSLVSPLNSEKMRCRKTYAYVKSWSTASTGKLEKKKKNVKFLMACLSRGSGFSSLWLCFYLSCLMISWKDKWNVKFARYTLPFNQQGYSYNRRQDILVYHNFIEVFLKPLKDWSLLFLNLSLN